MTTLIQIVLVVLLSGVAALSSYYYLQYVESLRFRPRDSARSFSFFQEHLGPRLKLEAEDGLRRFAVARQLALILLSLDLMLLTQQGQALWLAVLEAIVLASMAMAVAVHLIPSLLFRHSSGAWAARTVLPARAIGWVVQPFILLTSFVSSLAELSSEEPAADKPGNSSENIEALLDAGQEEGLIGQEDRKLIQSVVEFGDKTVREAMTPRPRVVAIEVNRSLEDLRQLFVETEYSRIPVFQGTIDTVRGFIHSRDTLEIEAERAGGVTLSDLMRPLPLTPDVKPIHQLLREMQENNQQMSMVVDEYGHTAGLVTMEDLMEEIVGEIRDESEPASDVAVQPDQSLVVSGDLDLDRLQDLVGFRPDEEFESTTLGGLICEHLGQVPSAGTRFVLDALQIEVLSADARHVDSVRMRRVSPGADPTPERDDSPAPKPNNSMEGAA